MSSNASLDSVFIFNWDNQTQQSDELQNSQSYAPTQQQNQSSQSGWFKKIAPLAQTKNSSVDSKSDSETQEPHWLSKQKEALDYNGDAETQKSSHSELTVGDEETRNSPEECNGNPTNEQPSPSFADFMEANSYFSSLSQCQESEIEEDREHNAGNVGYKEMSVTLLLSDFFGVEVSEVGSDMLQILGSTKESSETRQGKNFERKQKSQKPVDQKEKKSKKSKSTPRKRKRKKRFRSKCEKNT